MAKSRARKLADIIVGAGVDIDGNLTFSGGSTSDDLTFADNDKANFGDSSDLQIFHNGSHSFIKDAGTGDLYIGASNNLALMNSAFSENYLLGTTDGAVTLYYDGSSKLATFSGGVSVTGQLNATTMHLPDGSTGLQLGASNDTKFFHDGSNSKITHSGSGGFYIGADTLGLQTGAHNENYLTAAANGAVSLYYDNSAKLATASGGITVTGETSTTTLASGNSTMTGLVQIGNSSGGTLLFKRPSANYIFADQTGGYLVFGTNGRTTSLANSNFYLAADQSSTFVGQANFSDSISSDGPITINGSGSEDRYLKLALDGRGSAFTGENAAFIFCGQGGSGDFLAGGLYLQSRSATAGREIGFITGTTPAKRMVIDASGNVGINTASPSARFEVTGDAIQLTNGSYFKAVQTTNNANAGYYMASGSSIWYTLVDTSGRYQIYDGDAADVRVIVDGSGRVGIGNTNPNYKLDITAAGSGINITGTGAYLRWNAGDIQIKNEGSYKMGFYTYNSSDATLNRHMVIDTNGNVGIGTSSPTAPLEVQKAVSGNFVARFQNTNATTPYGVWIKEPASAANAYPSLQISDSTGTNIRFRVDSGTGNVGIGTGSPLVKLDVRGSPSAPATSGTAQTGSLRLSQTTGNGVLDMGFYTSSNGTAWLQSTNKSNLSINYDIALQPNGGSVGIGTTSPSQKLQVSGALVSTDQLTSPGSAGSYTYNATALDYSSNGARLWSWGSSTARGTFNFIQLENDGQNQQTALTIDTSGNVGIDPSSGYTLTDKLTVRGSQSQLRIQDSSVDAKGVSLLYSNSNNYGQLLCDHRGSNQLNFYYSALNHYFGRNTSSSYIYMTLTDTGNLGIGTTAPNSNGGTGAKALHIHNSNSNDWAVTHYTNTSTGAAANDGFITGAIGLHAYLWNYDAGDILLGTNSVTRFRIDSGGRVGIGVAPVSSGHKDDLLVQFPGSYAIGGQYSSFGETQSGQSTIIGNNIRAEPGVDNRITRHISSVDAGNFLKLTYNEGFTVHTGVTTGLGTSVSPHGLNERMRVDTSGNVLVGTTDTTLYNNTSGGGINLSASNRLDAARAGDVVATFNRMTNSGEVIQIYGLGSNVGSIGVEGNDSIFIQSNGANGSGLRFHPSSEAISPIQNGALATDTISFGTNTQRFKHLFLAGNTNTNGQIMLESGSGGTTQKLVFKTADNADESKFIRTNAYYLQFAGHQNEGFKFTDTGSHELLNIFASANANKFEAHFIGPVRVGQGGTSTSDHQRSVTKSAKINGMRPINALDWVSTEYRGTASNRDGQQTGSPVNEFGVTFGANGPSVSNLWKLGEGPSGGTEWLWAGISNSSNGGSGGWGCSNLRIDNNYSYLLVNYVKRHGGSSGGTYYFGTDNVYDHNGNLLNNPYFTIFSSSNLPANVWCVDIQIIHTYSYTANEYMENMGCYRMDTGARIQQSANQFTGVKGFRGGTSADSNYSIGWRTYLYYPVTNDGTTYYWAQPAIYRIDGTQPKLSELIFGNINATSF